MKNGLLFKIFPLILLTLTSCALPPREAWRVIQREGLIPYIAVEIGKKPIPPYVVRRAVSNRLLPPTVPVNRSRLPAPSSSSTAFTTTPVIAPTKTIGDTSSRYLEVASRQDTTPRPLASAPVSVPPPSTQRVGPGSISSQPPKLNLKPAPSVASKSASPSKETLPTKKLPDSAQAAGPKVTSPPNSPAKKPEGASSTLSQLPKAKTETSADRSIAKEVSPQQKTSVDRVPTSPNAKPLDSSVVSVPYGVPVPGRPGLVSSPYAGQYQLVDVTGLGAGQEVKCPYSGKIFRVPASQSVLNVPTSNLASPPQTPEKR